MNEIATGVYQLKVPIPDNPLGHTNVYLLQGDGEYHLIDTGWNDAAAFQVLSNQLGEIGVSFKKISQIIITHAHLDHYGLSSRLKELSRAKIAMHRLEKDLLGFRNINMEEFFRQTEQWLQINGVPTSELPASPISFTRMRRVSPAVLPDITLQGKETISAGAFNLQVIWTPGHSPGHICLYEPNRKVFFSGDHILPTITPNVSLQPQSTANPLGDFLNSLNNVKQLDVNLVLPAHEYQFADLPTRVDEIIHHHELRNLEVLEAISKEPKTAYQISQRITWMPAFGGVSFQGLAPWDKRMAISETLAHLEAMRVDGRIAKVNQDSIIYYQCT